MSEPSSSLHDREWFYPFELPDGSRTPTYGGGRLDAIHATRLTMLNDVLDRTFGPSLAGRTVVDLACHQGWFATQLAARGAAEVLAVDARQQHVDDANLIAGVLGHRQLRAERHDIHALDPTALGRFDVVLLLGLLYHLENPVGALRTAHGLTGGVCVVETQVVPHLGGVVDWGHHTFVKELQGCFGVIDETHETHGPEASTLGICLAPSTPTLLWLMGKLGFARVELLAPPPDAYEQLRFGKRVMVAGWVDEPAGEA